MVKDSQLLYGRLLVYSLGEGQLCIVVCLSAVRLIPVLLSGSTALHLKWE